MNIAIIEDEKHAAERLIKMIAEILPQANFYPPIDNIDEAISLLNASKQIDLIFLDIHLADGNAFEIFKSVPLHFPIIFTTSYDQYALKAFELNSIDYLLKPIQKEKLQRAIDKFLNRKEKFMLNQLIAEQLSKMITSAPPIYKETFLITFRDKLIPVPVKEFALFEIKNGVIYGYCENGKVYTLEERSLDELSQQLNPKYFFRTNRQFIVNKKAIKEASHYFNGKLLLNISINLKEKIIISREKAAEFKKWMEE
ncbi:Sensory transduction protein LytR [Mycovorax composti]|jgi:Response regulator of the LytR/AlgR family|uniref:Sensory transduction protein LytR n=2 Tax=Chitinophagaceae TaxID=563835 RepID=A0ABZ2EKP7_9BACT